MGKDKRRFLVKVENRLTATLLASVGFPVVCAAFFPLFVFLIMPMSAALLGSSLPVLHIYWLSAAGIWLVLLGALLPQMRAVDTLPVTSPIPEDTSPADIGLKKLSPKGSTDLLQEETKGNEVKRKSTGSSSSSSSTPTREKKSLIPDETEARKDPSTERNYEGAPTQSFLDDGKDGAENDKKLKEVKANRHSTIEEEEESTALLEKKEETEDYFMKTSVKERTSLQCHSETIVTSEEGSYECSLPSPTQNSGDRTSKNAVFIFVKSEEEN